MGQKLFDDGDSDGAEDISKIEIDQEFARRFEHNKRREDLHRLEELKKRGEIFDSSDDDSSEEEEDGEEIAGSKKTDLKFYDAIVRVKRNDPAIYQKDANLYSSSEEEEEEEEEGKTKKKKSKKEKPLYIKDVVAKHLLEEGPEYGEEQASKPAEPRSKSYLEEQEENKRAFLEAAGETLGSDGEDLFLEKKRSPGEAIGDEEGEIHNKLDEVFGEDENLDENDAFLKNFFLNKMWLDKSKDPAEEDLVAVSEEEEDIEKQEKYEADFNFRYQEGAGDRVLGHSRVIEGTVRKKTNARKLQRKSKDERMSQAEMERKEELKRLKNIKKKEIQEKLEKIRKIAGITESTECALDEADLNEDFDPEEYDRKMKKVFDADYYDAEDADPEFDDEVAKPNFDEEDELLGLPKDWINSNSSDGFLAARSKIMEQEEEEVEEDAEPQSESKRKRKRKISLHEKVELEKALEEYYKLDYEDTIGDLKTRFKYKSVPSNRFGLSAEEILMADDKELNQYVSLKKIAPYREEEWKVSRQKRYHQKIKKKLVLGNEEDGKDKREKKKKREKEDGGSEKGHSKDEEEKKEKKKKKKKKREDDDGGAEEGDSKDEMSRRSKRRRRQRELKLSQSRLAAYGKIPQKLN